jgi:hypothetical protein
MDGLDIPGSNARDGAPEGIEPLIEKGGYGHHPTV